MNTKKIEKFDLIVIGAGSGGVRASRVSASFGAKVAIVEASRFGGTCVIKGCIPKKILFYGSALSNDLRYSKQYGWNYGQLYHSWRRLIKSKDKEINRLEKLYKKLLVEANVKIFRGFGRFVDKNTIAINKKLIVGKKILISTGSYPKILDIKGMKENSITSDDVFDLDKVPKRIVIHGSGYIAIEFACIFNSLGSKVSLVMRSKYPLKGFDRDLSYKLLDVIRNKGINIYSNLNIQSIKKNKNAYEISLSNGKTICSEKILSATGRTPNITNLGLKKIGVNLDKEGAVCVNNSYQTNIKNVYAIGDVTNRVNLTPVAIKEGQTFAENQFNNKKNKISYNNIPTAVFSQPPIATVGLTEMQAREKHKNIDVYETSFTPLKNTVSGKKEKSYIKMITNGDTEKVLGIHMIGDDAPEIIQGFAIPVNMGAKKTDFDKVFAIHPTSAEEIVLLKNKKLLN